MVLYLVPGQDLRCPINNEALCNSIEGDTHTRSLKKDGSLLYLDLFRSDKSQHLLKLGLGGYSFLATFEVFYEKVYYRLDRNIKAAASQVVIIKGPGNNKH